jgi:NTE family protein
MLGLVMTAGGARGAYQAGVLKRLGELPAFRRRPSPFRIVAGASAGAINGATVAAMSGNFYEATCTLAQLWADLRVPDVFRADALSLSLNGLRLLQDLLLGGVFGGAGVQSLLNATPLRAFLEQRLPLSGIAESIRRRHLYAVAVTATSYHSGKSFTFIQGQPGHPVWRKARRVALPAELTLDHILASAAIPIVFQPVRLRSAAGEFWFGDGGLRLVTPLSPAIRLGATKIFAIGIRCQRSADDLSQSELLGNGEGKPVMAQPPLSQICGVFLNAIFLDHLDADLDHLRRMNELINAYGNRGAPLAVPVDNGTPAVEPMRTVDSLAVNPSEDLAIVASHLSHRMPRLVRYLMDGLGTPDAQSADLMSYLLFDSSYTRALVDIGYRDAGARIDEIESFLAGASPRAVPAVRPARPPARSTVPVVA